jgi:hypothetical protein
MMKRILIYVFVIFLSTMLLTGCTKKEKEVEGDVALEQEELEKEEGDMDLGDLSDPEEYTGSKQTLGEENDFEYTLVSLENVQGDGYHEFKFELNSLQEGATTPLVIVEPVLSKGVVKISFVNIVSDTTDFTHNDSLDINKGAITTLRRIATSVEDERVYEIGILTNNKFKLEEVNSSDGSWLFSLKVVYDLKYVAPDIDFGSAEFSSDMQSIEGMSVSDGVKIIDYSYLFSDGVLKFTFSVASGTSNPIPSVNAQYDDRGVLVVTFSSLELDRVSGWGHKIDLVSGVSVLVSREGESSVYEFTGISDMKPFRLSATQGPNCVVVEIKL